jgi:hypothetical protein
VSEDAQNPFTELHHSEEFQAADSVQQQMLLAVEFVRSDGQTILYTEIGSVLICQKP